ncbi:MAG TPA: methyltransferase domain-containing protein [Candidatus Binatia bacterium]|nr:methyltransferase domain-containing protein [Candidatus Binatia bacterium]
MDRDTTAAYEAHAHAWVAARRPRAVEDGRLTAFARRVRRGGRIADLGCGPGWYADHLRALGYRVVALDVAHAMLVEAGRRFPHLLRVRADLATLPFADCSLDGAWAANCYQHLPRHELPLALANLHAALRLGASVELTLGNLAHADVCTPAESEHGETDRRFEDDSLRGRLFSLHSSARARRLFEGAGFTAISVAPLANPFWLRIRARRAHTLPDLVGPNLRLLICGLNPSPYSADRGIPFARPGNRFWPAARRAGLITRERDPRAALYCGVGFTDLVKRATASATELRPREYREGVARIEELAWLYQPKAICFVGLDGWRTAVDRRAQPGWIDSDFAGCPAYLMPSTSGRNARVPLAELARHLRRAASV